MRGKLPGLTVTLHMERLWTSTHSGPFYLIRAHSATLLFETATVLSRSRGQGSEISGGQPDLDLPVRDPDLPPEDGPAVGLPQCLGPLAGPGHQRMQAFRPGPLLEESLAASPSPRAQEVAFQLAQNWVRTNFEVYSRKSAMYEKYDVSNGGQTGGGGEYDVQEGSGWTNGVVLMLLGRSSDRLAVATNQRKEVPVFLDLM